MSVAPYPEYKDSGVEWIGEIPAHWKTKRFRYVFQECNDKIDGEIFGEMLSVSGYRGIEIKNYDDDNRRRIEDELQGYRIVRKGQLVINTMWMNYAGLGVSEFDGHVSPAYRAFKIMSYINKRYAHHLLRSERYVKGYTSYLTGIRPNSLQMSREDLMNLPVLLPSPEEQSAIAAFLDQETGKIDALVAEQERLIALLKEKRQAVISQAVTKGLNPNAPMKDSGIEWLGQVPAHWETRKVSHLFCAGKGKNGQMLTKEFCAVNEGPYPVYSGQTEDEGVMGTWYEFEFDFGEIGVLFCTTVGARAMHLKQLYGRFSLSQNCMIVWPTDSRCITRFFFYHFQPLFQWERSLIPDHMQPSFRMEDLYSFLIGVPPITEQNAIVEFLDSETQKIDTLITEATQAITLLRERRAALISAAVTGKIDVRSLAPTKQEAA
jgi:type I restriction enzyme S subunit